MMFDNWQKEDKSLASFQLGIRANIRGLWNGNLSVFNFVDFMQSTITRGFGEAFNEGAAICGVLSNELSPQEIARREELINEQLPFFTDFALDIRENSRANSGLLGPLLDRGFMWINRYNEVKGIAQSLVCGDIKTIWIVGDTDHCRSCIGFNGRVYRESIWATNNAQTQGSNLCCHGFRCKCRREPTTQEITPGRFPAGLLC